MDYKQYNDYELIYMVRENDEDSSDLLYEKYQPILYSITHKHYKKFKEFGCEFEDFYQEAVYSFYKALSTYDSSKNALFYTYVCVCVERNLLSYGRRISNRIKKSLLDNYVQLDAISYLVEDPKENMNSLYQSIEVEKIIKDLIYSFSIDVNSMLELKLNGFSHKEIGILLDIPTRAVEFKLRRPKRILKNKISQYYCK